jgi:hypothetical protein
MPEYMTNFTGDDMKISRAKEQGSDQQAQAQQPQQAEQPQQSEQAQPQQAESQQTEEQKPEEEQSSDDEEDDSEPVPDGSTAEILQWVGDDHDRAQRALDKEQADDRPRTGLVGGLNKILGK